MKCFRTYTINVDGQEFKVSSPISGDETSVLDVFNALNNLKETDPEQYQLFIQSLETTDESIKKPTSSRNRDLPFLISKNLSKFGIEMEVLTEQEWNSFCEEYSKNKDVKIDSDARSFFLDGKIYVRSDKFKVEDSIHELSHLLLAVMRGEDFNKYQNFIHTLFLNPEVLRIAKLLQTYGTYSDNIELDFEEEAVVRYIEGLFTQDESYVETFLVDEKIIDTVDFLNKNLKDTVEKTFGITLYPGIIKLFLSLVKDVPEYGSKVFNFHTTSTGYKDMKRKAIESQRIQALINYYASEEGGNLIEKGECL